MYYVANNITRVPASGESSDFASVEFLCRTLNLDDGPGSRYGVYCAGERVWEPVNTD